MSLRIASWNVNSVRLRLDHLLRFLTELAPDVICLQEIKCQAAEFPADALAAAGYPFIRVQGQKGWHGVAIASRRPIYDGPTIDACREGHARSVSAMVEGVEIHNFYVPAGGDVPDRELNPKFDHKLEFLARLRDAFALRKQTEAIVVCGDLNVAPGEFDVWNHKIMSKVVSHTPIEIEALEAVKSSLGFVDPIRELSPEPMKLASWWSYRAADFRASNRGLRLDHIWATPTLAARGPLAGAIHDHVRAWERPSDHAPVTVDLAI